MNENLVFDIKGIQIIVHKPEDANFIFDNTKRVFDGFVMITSGNGYATDPQGVRHKVSKGICW